MGDKKPTSYKNRYKVSGEGFKLEFEATGKTEEESVSNAVAIAQEIVECLEEFINYGEFIDDEED